jgi:hypothetical protein
MFRLPPHRDPQLEASHGHPHYLRDSGGALVLSILAVIVLLGVLVLAIALVR